MNLTLREYSALASTVLITFGTIWYMVAAVKGPKVVPVLASWIVLCGTMTLSFATYWTSPRHNIVSNACNAISVLSTWGNLGAAIWVHVRKNRGQLRFSEFQKWCLGISGLIACFWIILVWGLKGTGLVPNILTQILMIVGYLVTAEKLWSATKNTESIVCWTCIMLGSTIALYTGIVSSDGLATLYAGRAAIASATLVWLMYRIERRSLIAAQAR